MTQATHARPYRGVAQRARVVGDDAVLLALVSAAGLVVRLLLLPATFHTDLYQIYSRANDAVTHGAWASWSGQIVIQQVHNAWFAVIRLLLPGSAGIWSAYSGTAGLGAQPDELARFLAYPLLGRALVLMKLPYLVADAVVALVLTRLVAPRRRVRALALWWLNPLVIYTSAVFGRHDSLSIVLLVLAVVLAQRGRRLLGLAALGLGGAARFFPLFALPFYVLAYRRSWREVALLAVFTAGAWVAFDLAVVAVTGASPTLTLLGQYPHVRFLVSLALTAGDDSLPVLPFGYALLVLWWAHRDPRGTDAFFAGGAAVLLLLVALMPFHPQYVIWVLPLLVPWLVLDARSLVVHAAQVGLYLVWLTRWGSAVTWNLLLPLGRDAVERLPDPQLVAAALVPTDIWQPVVRALFAAVTLWLGWRVLSVWCTGRSALLAAGEEGAWGDADREAGNGR